MPDASHGSLGGRVHLSPFVSLCLPLSPFVSLCLPLSPFISFPAWMPGTLSGCTGFICLPLSDELIWVDSFVSFVSQPGYGCLALSRFWVDEFIWPLDGRTTTMLVETQRMPLSGRGLSPAWRAVPDRARHPGWETIGDFVSLHLSPVLWLDG